MLRIRRLVAALAMLVALPTASSAAGFSQLVVFGDSLSDNGNVYAATGGAYPPFPYYNGRFSNGPVAVEVMAATLGVPLLDLAYGGATTGFVTASTPNYINHAYFPVPVLPNMQDTLQSYLAGTGGLSDPNALYVVSGGANDIFYGLDMSLDMPTVLATAVSNLVTISATLVGTGATHLLVPGLPDLGLTPFFRGFGPAGTAAGTMISMSFNDGLRGALGAYLPAGTWQYFDTFGLFNEVVADPAAFGFTNATDACLVVSPPSLCGLTSDAQNEYVFWDSVHPTAATHQILGARMAAAVPEPSTYALLLVGLCAVGMAARRARR